MGVRGFINQSQLHEFLGKQKQLLMDNFKTGWISLYRSIRKHWIWDDPRKLKWWLDILLEVNHEGKKVNIGYELFDCEKGQSIMSLKNWADRWGVSKDTARNFLKLLVNDNMIKLENLIKTTRITVCNYDSYQHELHANQTQTKRKPNANQTQTAPNNNDNNVNNDNNSINKEFSFRKSLIDLGIEKQIVSDWLKVRSKKKAANTETAFNGIKTQIEKSGLSANECIKKAVECSWSGFKADWVIIGSLNSKFKKSQEEIDKRNPHTLKFD